jgi:membrane peptidoglycan carboxypeptidase
MALPQSDLRPTYENNRIISDDTARKLESMLCTAVAEGTGRSAQVAGYTIAGKTGTAEKARPEEEGGGYIDGEYIVSFVGYLVHASRSLVCITSMDNPTGAEGNAPTGPLFASIMKFAATRYMLVPDHMTLTLPAGSSSSGSTSGSTSGSSSGLDPSSSTSSGTSADDDDDDDSDYGTQRTAENLGSLEDTSNGDGDESDSDDSEEKRSEGQDSDDNPEAGGPSP